MLPAGRVIWAGSWAWLSLAAVAAKISHMGGKALFPASLREQIKLLFMHFMDCDQRSPADIDPPALGWGC